MTKFSWNILQNYVDINNLDKSDLADQIALQVLEVEEVTDNYIDIDVTPNRAHDCLAHIGIAREIATVTKKDFTDFDFTDLELPIITNAEGNFSDEVRRFMSVEIDNVIFEKSPQWLQDRLKEIGQKSINTIVDLTNYVMFETGQPLHAYDVKKLPSSRLGVRRANSTDSVELLDGQKYQLDERNVVITDSNDRVLGLAGVKGGASSQISARTTSVLLESANFDPVAVRKSGAALGLRTDALKRFENEPSPAICEIAVLRFCQLLLIEQPNAEVKVITNYYPKPVVTASVSIDHSTLEQLLGIKIDLKDITDICHRQVIAIEEANDSYVFTAPYWRLDLNIVEDYVEEFGRLVGYDKIAEKYLPALPIKVSAYDLHTQIRNTLVDLGLYEVQTYALVRKGDFSTVKPLASDKGSLRKTIAKQLAEALITNQRNAELFSTDTVDLFEIGSVFPESGEVKHLAIALAGKQKTTAKKLDKIKRSLISVSEELVKDWNPEQIQGGTLVEISLQDITIDNPAELPESSHASFTEFSNQPFITRDISVWVNDSGSREELEQLIQNLTSKTLLSYRLVDEFSKDGRVSLAYRLVFQDPDKTLTDEQVNQEMNAIYSKLKNYELR